MDAEFFFQAYASHTVTLSERPIRIDEEFWSDEEGNTTRTFGRVRQPRKDKVDDVLGDVMVAPCDVNFLAGNRIGAITIRNGF